VNIQPGELSGVLEEDVDISGEEITKPSATPRHPKRFPFSMKTLNSFSRYPEDFPKCPFSGETEEGDGGMPMQPLESITCRTSGIRPAEISIFKELGYTEAPAIRHASIFDSKGRPRKKSDVLPIIPPIRHSTGIKRLRLRKNDKGYYWPEVS
jgi:hypothetical protein